MNHSHKFSHKNDDGQQSLPKIQHKYQIDSILPKINKYTQFTSSFLALIQNPKPSDHHRHKPNMFQIRYHIIILIHQLQHTITIKYIIITQTYKP